MNKKGISPLIATVLLIGFTIVLAALVMQWGGGLFDKIKTDTGISSEVNIICSSKLTNLDITSIKYIVANGPIVVTIDNSNDQIIAGFLFRVHKTNDQGAVISRSTLDTISSTTFNVANTVVGGTMNLEPFAVKQYTLTSVGTSLTLTKTNDEYGKLGVMAIITASDGNSHICTNEKLVSIRNLV